MARKIGLGLAILALVLVWIGFLGGFIEPLDTVAIHRPVYGLVCLAAMFLVRSRLLRLSFGATLAVVLATTIPPFLPDPPGTDLRLYTKNLLRSNDRLDVVADDIREAAPDVVMLQEVSDDTRPILDMLKTDYPHQHHCPYVDWGGIALLSRTAFEGEPHCSAERGVAVAPVAPKGTRLWAGSVHLPMPWPMKRPDNRETVLDVLEALEGPVVLAGDFNQMPWSARVREVGEVHGLSLAGPVMPTHRLWGVPIPIDLVLAPRGGRIERRGKLSSDHAGLVADVALQ
ncbi:endonuclease/exonuclease/phosphatase family protein [Jannaschia aquimarina]|uniref:Endonuclease/Exonuclease/phosphatase family protein n=1 Tax=Jannaschia aquimarina TaxID=935700 RepID=A0A0D1DCT5_9RHOB|nr:endonuclease/exonuclease/phosphatase family protein [Jannaschia aquimarina]KIT17783.1 Endonuclease/Exonuclease/phosphatase family protein [Jannaschia aquimarina]SNT14415.1 Uncharacterized conserved protein YafD, endonuclease/exonuclease/phosphatase (EEP) superfamily [Jannaschia aquimarina]